MINQRDKPEIENLIEQYLEKKSDWQQHSKALDLIRQYNENDSPTIRNRLGEVLAAHRHYYPRNAKYAVPTLLLECELEIVARKSQIDYYHTMLSRKNIFKRQACAGGKTTFLRKLIAKIKSLQADGRTMSCVITHEPLIAVHHRQLENDYHEAFGDKVYRFQFNRQDPTDTLSLRIILRNLYKVVADHALLGLYP